MRDAISSGNAFGNHGPSAKTNVAAVSVAAGPVVRMFCSRSPGAIAERRMSHQYLAARLSKGLGNHFDGSACAHDTGPGIVERERDVPQIELRVITRDVLDFRHLERNAELLPELLRSVRERFRGSAKDEIAGVEEEAHLHRPAPFGVEGRPPIDGAVRPGGPQLGVNAAVAVRAANTACLVAGCGPRISRAVGVDEPDARAQLPEIKCRPRAECARADDDHVCGCACLSGGSGAQRGTGMRRYDRFQKAAAVEAHERSF